MRQTGIRWGLFAVLIFSGIANRSAQATGWQEPRSEEEFRATMRDPVFVFYRHRIADTAAEAELMEGFFREAHETKQVVKESRGDVHYEVKPYKVPGYDGYELTRSVDGSGQTLSILGEINRENEFNASNATIREGNPSLVFAADLYGNSVRVDSWQKRREGGVPKGRGSAHFNAPWKHPLTNLLEVVTGKAKMKPRKH